MRLLINILFIILSLNAKNEFDLTETISVKNEFSISLPSNWVEIPEKIKIEYSKHFDISIDYAFQPKEENWFEDAYIVIKKNFKGKMSKRTIEKNVKSLDNIKTLKKSMKEVENKLKKRIGYTIENEIISKYYDDKRKIYWIFVYSNIQGMEPSMTISIVQFTENGFFQITCVSHINNIVEDLALYEQIINNFEVSEKIRYR